MALRYNIIHIGITFYTVSVNDLNINYNLVDWFLNKLRNSYIKSSGEYRIL